MHKTWKGFGSLYERRPTWAAVLLGSAFLVALSAIQALLRFPAGLRVLHVLPIWLATRLGGRLSGLSLVVFTTLLELMTDEPLRQGGPQAAAVNILLRFAALTVVMFIIAQFEEAFQKHQRMALRDPLTGLLNRRALGAAADDVFKRAVVQQQPTTVVVIDCDGFKLLNDTYGHQAGDHVLQILAQELEGHTRQSDLVSRIGGDEFALVLQDTGSDEARQIMTRVDQAFVASASEAGYPASGLSVGYSVVDHDSKSLEDVLDIADRAMYEHKEHKRASASLR